MVVFDCNYMYCVFYNITQQDVLNQYLRNVITVLTYLVSQHSGTAIFFVPLCPAPKQKSFINL